MFKKQIFEKKAIFPVKKNFGPFLSGMIEYDKCQEKLIRAHKVFDNYGANYKIISVTPKRLFKTQIFEKKKASFPVNKRFWPFLSRIIECDKTQGTICKGPKGIPTFTEEVIRSFL